MAYQPELDKLERQYYEDPARYFAQLAEAYRRAGRVDEALIMLREQLAGRPNYVSGLIVLGRCLLDQHNDAEARETFERVIAVDREHIIALRALGEIGERTGDVAGARQWYQRLLDIDPMNDEAVAALERLPLVAPAPPAPPPLAPAVPEPEERPEPAAPRGEAPVAAAVPSPAAAPPPEPAPPEPVPPVTEIEERVEARTAEFAGPETAAVEDEFILERTSGEKSAIPGPFAVPDGAATVAPEDDVSGWVEHPEELLHFDEGAGSAAPDDGNLGFESFDESLGWDAGERQSRQISSADLDAAEHAHADDLTAPAQQLPGLESEPVPSDDDTALVAGGTLDGLQRVEPDAAAEPVPGLEAEGTMLPPDASYQPTAAAGGPPPEDEAAEPPLAGLPVFFPEDDAREPLRVEPEPEPVVTETMAELYAQQGLVDEARETYRQLLASRPHDRRLAARLAELQGSGPERDARAVYASSATGGQSARSFLVEVLVGRQSGEQTAAVDVAPASPDLSVMETPPAEAEPMDQAFDEDAEPRGEPTQPAKDEISLAAIFGETAPAAPAPAPAPPVEPAGARPAGGFSFDEFFSPPQAPPAESAPRPSRDTLSDDEGEEAFRDWLKGLKS
jgi:tetratricopeptide (TPR) repeat protein